MLAGSGAGWAMAETAGSITTVASATAVVRFIMRIGNNLGQAMSQGLPAHRTWVPIRRVAASEEVVE
jgi:phosphate uptake regulator